MNHQSVLILSAREAPYIATIEPWAEEFMIALGQECRVVALHMIAPPTFEVEIYQGSLMVTVIESGSTFEFWRGGLKEFCTPVAIP